MVTAKELMVISGEARERLRAALASRTEKAKRKLTEEQLIAKTILAIDDKLRQIAKHGGVMAEFSLDGHEANFVQPAERMSCVDSIHEMEKVNTMEPIERKILVLLHQHYVALDFRVKMLSVRTSYGQYEGHHYRIAISWE